MILETGGLFLWASGGKPQGSLWPDWGAYARRPCLKATCYVRDAVKQLAWPRCKGTLWTGVGKRGSKWRYREGKKASPRLQGMGEISPKKQEKESRESKMSKKQLSQHMIQFTLASRCTIKFTYDTVFTHNVSSIYMHRAVLLTWAVVKDQFFKNSLTVTEWYFCKIWSYKMLENWSSTCMSWQWQFAIKVSRHLLCFCTY